MTSLNDLKLSNDKLEGASFDDIPENIGQAYPDLLQPGTYRFQLPARLNWEPMTSEKYGDRLNAVFEGEAALVVAQSPGGTRDGEEFRSRISNIPRERTRERILVSDMALLLRALGETKTPKTNREFGQALERYAGKTFSASVEWSYQCNPKKPAYFEDGNGGYAPAEDQRPGCGSRQYQRDVVKVNGQQPERAPCNNPECGASVRAFANLGGFKK